jgi:Cu/Ag efflux protein CusF
MYDRIPLDPPSGGGTISDSEDRMTSQPIRLLAIVAVLLAFCLSTASAQSGKKEYQFRGKIEKVDPKANTLTVDGENVEGWMKAMTMIYKVDKADVIKKVKAGDQITAKVYDGDYETLHDVQPVTAKDTKPPAKK